MCFHIDLLLATLSLSHYLCPVSSTCIVNALLGTKLLETGALPTTDSIILLTHGETNSTEITNAGEHFGVVIHKISDVPLLQDLTFVDTPGTNAVVLNHTARTMKLLPSADLSKCAKGECSRNKVACCASRSMLGPVLSCLTAAL